MNTSSGQKKIVLRTMDANRPEDCVKLDSFDTVEALATHLSFNSQPEDGFYSIRDADLTGLRLKPGLRMKKLHLEDVILKDADLQDVMLNVVDFKNVDFTGAKLSDAMLIGGRLKGCVFDGADMRRASLMRLDVRNGSFKGINIEAGELEASKFFNTSFRNANLDHCDLRRVTLQGCDLRGASTEYLEDFNEYTVLNTRYDPGFARQMKGGIGQFDPRVSPGRMKNLRRRPKPA